MRERTNRRVKKGSGPLVWVALVGALVVLMVLVGGFVWLQMWEQERIDYQRYLGLKREHTRVAVGRADTTAEEVAREQELQKIEAELNYLRKKYPRWAFDPPK